MGASNLHFGIEVCQMSLEQLGDEQRDNLVGIKTQG